VEVLVFGAGSLGSLVGGLLAREHRVTLVGRDPHVSAVDGDGLTVTGALSAAVEPAAATAVPAAAAPELVVVTVKAYDTPAAVEALEGIEAAAVLTLQNGMGPVETLREGLATPVLAGTCTYGARLAEPGVVECTGVGDVVLGAPGGGPSELADRVGGALAAAGVETEVATDMPRRRWLKLAVNAGINATTALARVENGALLAGPAGGPARAAAREVAALARERGVGIAGEEAVAALEGVARDTAANTSSMCQDVAAGSRTEVDAINGYVADALGPEAAPVNATLAGLLRAWEADRGLRDQPTGGR